MPSKHPIGTQNGAEFHERLLQQAGSPDGQNAQQRLRPESSPALFLVKSGVKSMWCVPAKGKPMIVPARRPTEMHAPQLQRTQGRGPSVMMAFALLGWFAHAFEVWLRHQ